MRHPCIICDDVGSYRYEGGRYACDCRAGQRLSNPSAFINPTPAPSDATPMIATVRLADHSSDASAAIPIPSSGSTTNVVTTHLNTSTASPYTVED